MKRSTSLNYVHLQSGKARVSSHWGWHISWIIISEYKLGCSPISRIASCCRLMVENVVFFEVVACELTWQAIFSDDPHGFLPGINALMTMQNIRAHKRVQSQYDAINCTHIPYNHSGTNSGGEIPLSGSKLLITAASTSSTGGSYCNSSPLVPAKHRCSIILNNDAHIATRQRVLSDCLFFKSHSNYAQLQQHTALCYRRIFQPNPGIHK